eukprot:2505590-Ditylum_brightwellii.AAC.1
MPASFDSKRGRDHLSAVRGMLCGSVPDGTSAVRLSMSALQSLASVGGKGYVTATGESSDADRKAFRDCRSFFTDLQKGSSNILATSVRLSWLAGLICAQCMPLWRVTMSPDNDDNLYAADWINKHPMFDRWNAPAGITVGLAQAKLQTTYQLLLEYGASVLDCQRGVQQCLDHQQLTLNDAMDINAL